MEGKLRSSISLSVSRGTVTIVASCCVIAQGLAQGYAVTVIAPAESFGNGQKYDINNKGQLTGNTRLAGSFNGFIWTPSVPNGTSGSMRVLTYASDPFSEAHGLNNFGDAVGRSWRKPFPSSSPQGVLWPSAGGSLLVVTGVYQVEAEAINDAGDIVMYYNKTGGFSGLAVSVIANGKRKLYKLGTYWPYSINNNAQIIDHQGGLWTPNAGKTSWTRVQLPAMGVQGGEINDSGAVVGGGTNLYLQSASYGLPAGLNSLWNAVVAALRAPTTGPSWLSGGWSCAINNGGTVVGTVEAWNSTTTDIEAFIWDPVNAARSLSELVPGWTDIKPNDINDYGQIVATASNDGGFTFQTILLTPQ